ncbi:PREDICTED: uncharacterized protein LOC105449474 [Wasmannia auropunctata]|uniref:uncharacterized protein LOC105449474 n=1 Tax=Wasmannia auropunctata TaxID=64793 RepID=UPI0005EF22A7|nr:PREDICTED: uncharacterized protein LOC105449474 [Wasmannia auropunctata]
MGPKNDLFTKDVECSMIEMVKQCPLLWDTTMEQYRRTDLKRVHWDRIAQALGPKFTGDIVYKRFQNMESTFRANERRIRESQTRCSGKGADEIYKPKWEYYDMLLFLKKTCTQSDSIDNLSLQNYSNQETVNRSSVPHTCTDVQNTSMVPNIYCDENIEQYMLIPSDACTNSDKISPSMESYSSEASSDLVSIAMTSASQSPISSTSQDKLAINETSDLSSRTALASLNTKRPPENSLYVKQGSLKKSKIMEDAVNAIKDMAQENVSPPKMDTFDMFGAYIASRLRSMTPSNREYFEREILKVLSQPTL